MCLSEFESELCVVVF